MVCHGELAALKPSPRHLTSFYLTIAAGGRRSGLLIAAAAPVLLRDDYDLALLLPCVTLPRDLAGMAAHSCGGARMAAWSGLLFPLCVWVFMTGSLRSNLRAEHADVLISIRNFLRPLRVTQFAGDCR